MSNPYRVWQVIVAYAFLTLGVGAFCFWLRCETLLARNPKISNEVVHVMRTVATVAGFAGPVMVIGGLVLALTARRRSSGTLTPR